MATAVQKAASTDMLKLTIERSALLRSLARLQTIVERRNTIPILANVKLDTMNGQLHLTVTDMDLVATETLAADTKDAGSLTVPAQTFYDIVRKLPDGAQIALESNARSSQLSIVSGSAKFALSYLPSADFPVMSEGSHTHRFSMPSKECLRLIEKARFAMSTEETRYYLNGVYFHISPDKSNPALVAAATDGHRLARIETAIPQGTAGMPGVIIPRKAVNELRKLLEEQGDNVEIALSETKIRFASGQLVLLSKLVDGTFPDYVRVIPSGNDKAMEVDAAALTQAVDRVSTISTEKTRAVKFGLEAGKLTLSAQSQEAGSASEELEVSYSAAPMEIGFNSRYVLEMMSQIEGDTVQFLFNDANAPALARDPANTGALYVIMPMRV